MLRIVLYNHGNLGLAHSFRETARHVGSSTFVDRKGFVSRVGQKEQEPPRTEELAETGTVSQKGLTCIGSQPITRFLELQS